MRKKFLFCTRLRVYLIELPLIILFAIAIHYNEKSDELMRLYPLIIFLALAMIFILVYFFRAISISFDEVRYHGLFSSRDHASITKDKELILTVCPGRRLRVELFGNDGAAPELDFIKNSEDYTPVDIFLFRGKAWGTKRHVASIMRFFGVNEADIPRVFTCEKFVGDYEFVSLKSEVKDDKTTVRLKFKETV